MAGRGQALFNARLKKYYAFYTGGFVTFVAGVGLLEWLGASNKLLGIESVNCCKSGGEVATASVR